MQIKQSNKFKKAFKKLPKDQQKAVENAIREIVATPEIGESKKGDLSSVRVYKFKIHQQLILLAYQVIEIDGILYLLLLGTHENFYRDLKQYL